MAILFFMCIEKKKKKKRQVVQGYSEDTHTLTHQIDTHAYSFAFYNGLF